MNETLELIALIGTPFSDKRYQPTDRRLESIYEKAFADRVALLYLSIHRRSDWTPKLEALYSKLEERRAKTLSVVSSLSDALNRHCLEQYTIFKSLKPYPATPNDTDVVIFGDKVEFDKLIQYLYLKEYLFHEWAPMQTTLIHPDGKGKTGKGKKGGTYYIDMYSDISTDYFLYIDKRSLIPYVETRIVNGQKIRNVRKEVELAIILFHNVFPERTFQLEHFYMPLYHFKEDDFDMGVFTAFAEGQRLVYAIATNLTIVEYVHDKLFGFVPDCVSQALDQWGRNPYELERFRKMGEETPYMFSPRSFWTTFLHKIRDNAALASLLIQGVHMLNPIFFFDVMKSLKNRFSEHGTYHLE